MSSIDGYGDGSSTLVASLAETRNLGECRHYGECHVCLSPRYHDNDLTSNIPVTTHVVFLLCPF